MKSSFASFCPRFPKLLPFYALALLAVLMLIPEPLHAQACAPPPSGLVSWWPGNGNTLDVAGTNDGTLQGNATFGLGEVGQAFSFDGSGDFVLIGNPTNLQIQTLTIEAWIKRGSITQASLSTSGGAILGYGTRGYLLGLLDNGSVYFSQVDLAAVNSTIHITDTAWHHVAVTRTGMNIIFYVDGVANTVPPSPSFNPQFEFITSAAIGARADNLDNSFLGLVDEVSIYNRVLAASEIQTIFNAGSTGKCPDTTPPSIVSQPTNQATLAGGTVSFSVIGAGARPLSYQWVFGSNNVAGGTNSTLILDNVQMASAGNYFVVVSNLFGTVASSNALLTVNPNPTGCAPPASGLVSWWPGNGNGLDAIGTNNGTLKGNTTFTAGKVGQAFSFDGNGDGVSIGNPASLQLQNLTIEAWIKRSNATLATADGTGAGHIFAYGSGGYVFLILDDGTPSLGKVDVSSVQGSHKITDTALHHAAVTKNGTNVVFYVDGISYPAAPYDPGFSFTTPAAIGARGDNLTSSFLGLLDEVSIYNRALTAAEIQSIVSAGSAGKCAGVAPLITAQPAPQTVPAGASPTFTVTATGTAPLGYQWKFGSNIVAGATNSSLTVTNAQQANAGNYSVVVSNPFGTVASSNALLTVTTVSNVCTPPPSGLVAWWPGNGNALDAAGTNNGTAHGVVGFGAGKVGQGFVFDGSTDGILIGNPTNLQLQNFTIETWIERSNTNKATLNPSAGGTAGIVGYGTGGYIFGILDDGTPFLSQTEVSNVTGGNKINDLALHHLAVTKNGNTVVFYVDGVASVPINYVVTFQFNTSLGVGSRGDNFGDTFFGLVDEASIYNRALTAAEIQTVFAAGTAGKCGGVAPLVLVQPTSQAVPVGSDVTFSVGATGSAPLGYQWRFGSNLVAGATNSFLTVTNVQLGNGGNYSALVSNPFGTVTSSNALLTVTTVSNSCTPPPSGLVAWWPGNGNALDAAGTNNGTAHGVVGFGAGKVGQGFVFDGSTDGILIGNPTNLQLQNFTIETWIERSNTNNATLNPSAGGTAGIVGYGTGGYIFGILDDGTPFLSQTEASNVTGGNKINDLALHHLAVTKNGNTVVFYVDGVASVPINYVVTFQFNTSLGVGSRGDNFGDTFFGLVDEASIYNRALTAAEIQTVFAAGTAGKCGGVAPLITGQPANQTVTVGGSAAFAVTATGPAPILYQWKFGSNVIAGATNSALTVTNVQPANGGNYSVVVSNPFGTVTSSNALLTVNAVSNTCTPAPSGLVSWWKGESNALDAVGGNNGSFVGTPVFAAGEVGQAFSFDGHTKAVVVTNTASLQLQDFTIETWIKRGSTTQATLQASGGGTAGIVGFGHAGYLFGILDNGQPFLSAADLSNVKSLQSITDLNFHHLAVTKSGTTVSFYVDGAASAPTNYAVTFQFGTLFGIGSRGDNLDDAFLGVVDEVSVYNRALTASEIQSIVSAGNGGKCSDVAPLITVQPASQSVPAGSNVTFSVSASGSAPLGYQWLLGSNNLAGATNSSLSLTNVQAANAGSYSVTVSNPFGTVVSSNAVLTVTPGGSVIQVVSVSASGGVAVVPIDLVASGNENALGFSINFDPSLLTVTGVTLGSNAPTGLLFSNTNLVASGELGVALSLPANATFAAGTQEVVRLSFATKPVTRLTNTPITFGDQPTLRQVSDAHAVIISATYVSGTVTIPFGLEGDVSPRHSGDGVLSITDWVQVGRFVAGLDTMTPDEFQRTDCAPRATFGDGLLTVADWVQVGRYAAGLDPATPAGGPTGASGSPMALSVPSLASLQNRTLAVLNANTQAGQTCDIPVQMDSLGNENGVGFSLVFDPAALTFTGATLGGGASGGTLNVNDYQASSGTIGLALVLPSGSAFAASLNEVAVLHFTVASAAAGNTKITFASIPVTQDVADATAISLPVTYVNGNVSILSQAGSPVLTALQADGNLVLSWPTSAAGFNLESSDSPDGTNWNVVDATLVSDGTTVTVTIPPSQSQQFFRLHHQ